MSLVSPKLEIEKDIIPSPTTGNYTLLYPINECSLITKLQREIPPLNKISISRLKDEEAYANRMTGIGGSCWPSTPKLRIIIILGRTQASKDSPLCVLPVALNVRSINID
ncbi:hypothetical protein V1477_003794 [Vespula maculifrons]|uniref:Uncharacterized protein n=1 Tax=Vespula maculifrons TaxID=7453 RepID=A0ABD2CT93_VESMC